MARDQGQAGLLHHSIYYLPRFVILVVLLVFSRYPSAEILRMAATTTIDDSGLLSELNAPFEDNYGVEVHVLVVGSGAALRIGANGNVDVIFTHAPEAELKFVDQGHGIDRQAVMHNDFIIVGPARDPARIRSAKTAPEAFQFLAKRRWPFISRGDDSGTHKKERALWRRAGVQARGAWYVSAGQGMGAVLTIAEEKNAYALSDRGTYLSFKDRIGLERIFECDTELSNPYHIIAVNPTKHAGVNYPLARKYLNYVTSGDGQRVIAGYKKDGRQLFYPDALPHLANQHED